MKTIEEFCEYIEKIKNQPHELAELQLEIAVKHARMGEIYKDVRQAKSQYWKAHKGDRSDKAVEIDWYCTPDGEKELRAKTEIKSLQMLSSSAKTYLRQLENEARNIY